MCPLCEETVVKLNCTVYRCRVVDARLIIFYFYFLTPV